MLSTDAIRNLHLYLNFFGLCLAYRVPHTSQLSYLFIQRGTLAEKSQNSIFCRACTSLTSNDSPPYGFNIVEFFTPCTPTIVTSRSNLSSSRPHILFLRCRLSFAFSKDFAFLFARPLISIQYKYYTKFLTPCQEIFLFSH